MADRKILNLDALIPDKEFVLLDGVEHEIKTPSVGMYLTVMKARSRMKNADNDLEAMEQSIALITLACPDIPEARLKELPLPALTALAERIQALMEGEDESTDGTSDEAQKSGE